MQLILPNYQRDERVEQSVNRMMTIIDLARNIRERHNKALKTPLKYVRAPLEFCIFIFSIMACIILEHRSYYEINEISHVPVIVVTLIQFGMFFSLLS